MKAVSDFPRIRFGILPTPLYRLDGLSKELGRDIYIKRDDMTGVSLGGNKVRKLEFLLADARAKGADCVLTTGGVQSNHAMLTAACANRCGMKALLVLKGRETTGLGGNQVLNGLLGADVRFVDAPDYRGVYAEMERIADGLRDKGHTPYTIPLGGSVPLGSLGYVLCAEEIAAGMRELGVPLHNIVCAEGSGGTHAGLAVGAALFAPQARVTGIAVSDDPFERVAKKLIRDTAALIEAPADIGEQAVNVKYMVGEGYAIPSSEGREAMRLMARTEGLILDPVYTGKAFAGMLALIAEGAFGKNESIVFLHSGGAGGVFA